MRMGLVAALAASIVMPVAAGAQERRQIDFDVPAQDAAAALNDWSRATGIQILFPQDALKGRRVSGLRGRFAPRVALDRLIATLPLRVVTDTPRMVALRAVAPVANHDIVVTGKVTEPSRAIAKRVQQATVDAVPYDDVETLAPDGGIAEQLRFLPGVTTEDEGDSSRFVIIRGAAPDLNQTTIDGISIATIGNDGEGSRQVNLQIIPAELSQRTDVYKTFTAEQDGGAIGGVIDIISRSPLDQKHRYALLDSYGIYSAFGGPDGRNAPEKSWRHFGGGFKGVFADRFGADGRFGIALSARYQSRVRNSAKWWQVVKTFFDAKGKEVAGPDAPGWDGRVVPGDHSFGSYTNRLQTAGSSAKLEWDIGDGIRASLLGFGFRMWESSSMNKNDIYTARSIIGTTPSGGRSVVNSLYTRFRFDNWDKKTFGGIGNLGWTGEDASLRLRVGHTKATFTNEQPSIVARALPRNLFLDWEEGDDEGRQIPRATALSNTALVFGSSYALNGATQSEHRANETLTNARLDYAWNAASDDRGIGVVTGLEWRRLDLDRDLDQTVYRGGASMTPYLFDPDYRPFGSPVSFPWIDYPVVRDGLLPRTAIDRTTSSYNSRISDYRYVERLWTPYLSVHYSTGPSRFIAGLRYDHVAFVADQPVAVNRAIQPQLRRNHGGYSFLLPSFQATHDVGDRLRLRASYSRTLGRPIPGDIARAESVTCGVDDDGGTDCAISRGNPNLRPRQSDNFDVGLERYFGRNGVIAVAAFAKRIRDDIFFLRSIDIVDGAATSVRQPLNAESSRLYGAEFQVSQRDLKLLGVRFDPFANATVVRGQMRYANDSGTRTIDRLLYQPGFSASAGAKVQLPQIDGAFSLSAAYRNTALRTIGAGPKDDSVRTPLTVVNAALWHNVAKGVLFKYELANAFNSRPTMAMGQDPVSVSQIDVYGRTAFFHIVIR